MKHKSEFDSLVVNYKLIRDRNVRISGETSEYFDRYKCRYFLSLFGKEISSGRTYILDYGCGIGNLSFELASSGCNGRLFGLDPSFESLKAAAKRVPGAGLIHFDGSIVPLKEGVFDLVIIANVLHHARALERQKVLNTAAGILKKKGKLIIYEHNPLNPLTAAAFKNNLIDRGASMLNFAEAKKMILSSGLRIRENGYIVFFPRILKVFRPLEPRLAFLPVGAQYFITGEKG